MSKIIRVRFGFITITILFFSINFSFANLNAKVDERFELTSIIFRLANANEFVNNNVPNYVQDIDNYFKSYKNDTLIKFVKRIREDRGIGYDAVSNITGHLLITKNTVCISPKVNIHNLCVIDDRWNLNNINTFVKLLNKFYKKTGFHNFYVKHNSLYEKTQSNFNVIFNQIESNWFQSFFGKSLPNQDIIVNLCNGSSNYSLTVQNNNNTNTYGIIIGCVKVDKNRIPIFDESIIPTIIHEICHQYTVPLIKSNIKDFLTSANAIFPFIEDKMRLFAYGDPETLIYENINRLCVNAYFKEYPNFFEQYYIKNDEDVGFIWMDDMVTSLDNFYNNREVFKSFSDYLPQLSCFMKYVSDNFETVQLLYKEKYPVIVSVFPNINSIVSDSINEIRITFSRPMWDASSISVTNDSTLLKPKLKLTNWSDDKKTFVISTELSPNTNYGFTLNHALFLSDKAYSLKDDFIIKFNTK
ncbi:MAG: hypothetical protein H6Q15_2358 [Bacteroidetes bacterium]|nr:hypothetical protein [Bacteroidota bacterium]